MKQRASGTYFLPDADWAYLITFVLPDYATHSGTGVSWRSPNATHMEMGKDAVRGWFNRLRKPLKALGAPPAHCCCIPELKDPSGNPTPLHFHALVSRSLAFEQMFGGLDSDVYEQEIWHACLKKFRTTKLRNVDVSAEIKQIYCINGIEKYIMKNVDDNFNIQNIIDIK
jgi:hypothetical protein